MAVVFVCPQCGKTLKLLESMPGKTIRCPVCKTTFTAPLAATTPTIASTAPSAQGKIEEVLPAGAGAKQADEPVPIPEAVPDQSDGDHPRRRSRPVEERERYRRTQRHHSPPARKRWSIGLVLGIGAAFLIVCGGMGLFTFMVGKNLFFHRQIPDNPWQAFRPDQRCVVSMPGAPTPVEYSYPATIDATGMLPASTANV